MLIAQLTRFTPFGGEVMYCATDPFDGEILTRWHETISAVDDELQDLDKSWGLNLAAYAGESDVPARPSDEEFGEPGSDGITCYCPALSGD